MNASDWLRSHTFYHEDFKPLDRLVELKREQDLTINVSLPTLNEEDTIAKEILLLSTELMEKYPLVDEIAVVDSGSRDRTREIAREYGASVFLASEHLQEEGIHQGKGENLWKSLYLLDGDIIVYVDADIRNIHPKFVYGLVGPLLEDEDLGYVKAFYERPIEMGDQQRDTGGGRVTEILIRPLFNLLYPELAGFLQPLSGEYAGRREVLEQLPFFIGYGVETGLLIDILETFGLESMAQVDLDRRVHENQDVKSLGRMAFGILQTFLGRADQAERIKLTRELAPVLRQIVAERDRYEFDREEREELERPPMITLDEYREKHNRDLPDDPGVA